MSPERVVFVVLAMFYACPIRSRCILMGGEVKKNPHRHIDDGSITSGRILFAEIRVELRRGLPAVTVPLPSRRELCQFTLRPVTNTVGDFIDMLKTEDQGVDRVVVSGTDGVRVASSNTIESLMDSDFRLTVNDRSFTVRVPPHKKLTKVSSGIKARPETIDIPLLLFLRRI